MKIKQFKGINNVTPAERLESGELRDAVNVDIDHTGKVSRRKGYRYVWAEDCHSLWSDSKNYCLFRSGDALKRLTRVNGAWAVATLRSGLEIRRKMAFFQQNKEVYFSDGVVTGVIQADNVIREWGITVPSGMLTLDTDPVGLLPAGSYQVTSTFLTADGRESGAERGSQITLTADGGIRVSNMQPPASSGIVTRRVYVTTTNSDIFYLAGSIPVSDTSVVITTTGTGVKLRTQFMTPAPAGTIVSSYNARMIIVSGDTVWYSEPFAHEWFMKYRNYLMFAGQITMFVVVGEGAYVSADRTYFLSGDSPEKFTVVPVTDSVAIAGTAVVANAQDLKMEGVEGLVALWTSDDGMFVGTSTGKVINVTKGKVAFDSSEEGTALLKERGGLNQYVSLLREADQPSAMKLQDVVITDIRRNGVIIT